MPDSTFDKRVEAAARAMARHRLAAHVFSSTLTPDLVADLLQSAQDKLWPTLTAEAQAALEAADQILAENAQGPASKGRPNR